jgi:hypothetical protein
MGCGPNTGIICNFGRFEGLDRAHFVDIVAIRGGDGFEYDCRCGGAGGGDHGWEYEPVFF